MTRQAVIRRLKHLSAADYAKVAPFLEADLALLDDLDDMRREAEAGRRSARTEPLLKAQDVYARVRNKLAKK